MVAFVVLVLQVHDHAFQDRFGILYEMYNENVSWCKSSQRSLPSCVACVQGHHN